MLRQQPESLIFRSASRIDAQRLRRADGWVYLWTLVQVFLQIIPALLVMAALAGLYACGCAALPCFPPCGPWTAPIIVFWDVWGSRFGICGRSHFLGLVNSLPMDTHIHGLFGLTLFCRSAYAASITIGLPIDQYTWPACRWPGGMYLVGYTLPAFLIALCRQAVHLQGSC